MVEQVEEEVVAPDPAEQVHRLAGPDVAAGHLLAVDPVERGGQARDRRRLQRPRDARKPSERSDGVVSGSTIAWTTGGRR